MSDLIICALENRMKMRGDNVSFKGRDILTMSEFNAEEIMCVLGLAKDFKNFHGYIKEGRGCKEDLASVLGNKKVASLFFEESTRTSGSFETAIKALGGEVIGFTNPKATSVTKGEPLIDTIRMYLNYGADAIVMRHPVDGAARFVADKIGVPVLNAGDGSNQHPTQAFLDLFTILETQGKLDNLTIAMAGDLKYSRTVHSNLLALNRFPNNKFLFVSPPQLKMPKHILEMAGNADCAEASLEDALHAADIFYDTRIQKNRFPDTDEGKQEYERVKDAVKLDRTTIERAKPKKNMRLMHPLPRDKTALEISYDVDDMPCAVFIQQAENGVYAREALLALVLNDLNSANNEYKQERKTSENYYVEQTLKDGSRDLTDKVVVLLENGVSIDHIPQGKGKIIAKILDIYSGQTRYAVAGNLRSDKYGKKDMIKIHDRKLTEDEIKKIAIIAPTATISDIKEGTVMRKIKLQFPETAEKLLVCNNLNCISQPKLNEGAHSVFYTASRKPLTVQCHYCERTMQEPEFRLV